ncbi:MAG: hypothetical protein AAFR21_06295 [Pseudomonadota bacterium]
MNVLEHHITELNLKSTFVVAPALIACLAVGQEGAKAFSNVERTERSATGRNVPTAGNICAASYAWPNQQMKSREAFIRLQSGIVEWHASIAYTDGQFYNPATGKMDAVKLCSYQVIDVDPEV